MKKILVIRGAGRASGNTEQLINRFVEGAQAAGHEVEVISLLKMKVYGCIGCNACRYGKPCVQQDDFAAIVPKLMAADLWVFAFPLYYWGMPARMKAFIERFYCLAEEDLHPPLGRSEKYPEKDCAMLVTAADNFFWTFSQIDSYYRFALIDYIGLHDKGTYYAGGCGDTNDKPRIEFTGHLDSVYEFGKNIYAE